MGTDKTAITLPPELEKVRQYARQAIAPIKPSGENTEAERDFLLRRRLTVDIMMS